MRSDHESVLLKEGIKFLNIKRGGRYIDATLGAGGHGVEILKRGGRLLGIDQDRRAIEIATVRLGGPRNDATVVHGNFRDIKRIAEEHNFLPVDGVIFDLGMSSMQLEKSGRGFSFMHDEPLDMRMDPEAQGVTAADLVNSLREDQLYELFSANDTKNLARAISRAIVAARPVVRTAELVEIVNGVVPRRGKISPATTIFMALRMAVNSEIENLRNGLSGAVEILSSNGRLVVISFHSGEDRIVKNFMLENQKEGVLKILTKNIVVPTEEEVRNNPRSRSAKLRAVERI